MKILVITQYFYPEIFRVNTLCTELVKLGHDVTVLTGYPQYPQGKIYEGYGFNKPYEKKWNGIKIERIKMRPRGKTPIGLFLNCLTFVFEGNKWVRRCKEKFDAVYVFEVSPVTVGLPAVTYKKKFGTPIFFNLQDLWPENVEVVLGIHNKIVIGIINKIVDKIYSASDKILCSSNGFVENLTQRGVPKEKLVFWPQFCSRPALENAQKPSIYRDGFFNIVFAGNIGDAQGLDLLVDTAIEMKDTKLRWFLVGDGRSKESLQNKVKANKIEDIVTFVGKVSEEEANVYIHFASCAYLSFKNNKLFDLTIPAKLQSYLACGTPILAAAGGESAKIVRDNSCGFVSVQTVDKLKEVLSFILSLDSLEEYKKNALCTYNELFDKDRLVLKLVDLMSAELKEACDEDFTYICKDN